MKRKGLILSMFLCAVILLPGCGAVNNSTSQDPSFKATQAVKAAYSQMGKKYCPGGASPRQGFDCSGLIYWAYKSNGVKIPRITRDQARAGNNVEKKHVLPGDIMVFRVGGSGTGLHTALYAGGNSFIHSPRPGEQVRMETLSTPYWNNKLIAVRRVAN